MKRRTVRIHADRGFTGLALLLLTWIGCAPQKSDADTDLGHDPESCRVNSRCDVVGDDAEIPDLERKRLLLLGLTEEGRILGGQSEDFQVQHGCKDKEQRVRKR